jgi:hypothetical protein
MSTHKLFFDWAPSRLETDLSPRRPLVAMWVLNMLTRQGKSSQLDIRTYVILSMLPPLPPVIEHLQFPHVLPPKRLRATPGLLVGLLRVLFRPVGLDSLQFYHFRF